MSNLKDEQEQPLDPAIEHIRHRMMRHLFVSMGIMLTGLMAVLGAVVYKVNTSEDDDTPAPVSVIPGEKSLESGLPFAEAVSIALPSGASVLSSRLSGHRLILDIRLSGGTKQIWFVNMNSGTVESRVRFD